MTSEYARLRKIAVLEMGGFLLILAIILLDEIFDMPHMLLGAEKSPGRAEEYLIEGVAVACLGAAVAYFSFLASRRVKEMEAFLIMCAWCRRVKINSHWIPVEDYLRKKDELRTSHGICQDCAKKIKEAMKKRNKL